MSKAKVLVIDDDPEMLDLARFHLEKNGYEVTSAETGAQGLRLVAEHRHEVALTDLKLPDIDGIELVMKLKESSPATEVIMITGYGAVTEAIEATKAGAFYFMEKPVEFEELMALIRSSWTSALEILNVSTTGLSVGSPMARRLIVRAADK